jgi:hypothetical protein
VERVATRSLSRGIQLMLCVLALMVPLVAAAAVAAPAGAAAVTSGHHVATKSASGGGRGAAKAGAGVGHGAAKAGVGFSTTQIPGRTIGNTNCGTMSLNPSTAVYGGEGLTLGMNWVGSPSDGNCRMMANNCSTFFSDCNVGYWLVGIFCSTLAAQDFSSAESYCDLNNLVVLTDDSSGPDNNGQSGTSWNTCNTVKTLGNIFGGLPGTIECVTDGSTNGWSENWPTGSTSGNAYGIYEQTGSGTPFQPANTSADCPPSAANIAAGAIANTCAFVVIPVTFVYACAFYVCVPDVTLPNDGISLDTSDYMATFFQYEYAPSFTSGASTTVQAGSSLSYQVSTNASPAATVTATGALPQGVTFTQEGGGTALISGTPALTTAGTYYLTLTAGNGISPNATQYFTLVVTPPPPEVAGFSPSSGPSIGGTAITISGAYLDGTTGVSFGTTPAASFTQVNSGEVTAVSPAGSGTVPITLATPAGSTNAPGGFTYIPPPTINLNGLSPATGPAGGGTTVTISGSNLGGTSKVTFGGVAATGVTVVNTSEVSAITPAGSGSVNVTLTTPSGTTTAPNQFTYIPAPTIASSGGLEPTDGPTGGGTVVTITGTNLAGTSLVTFGPNAATGVTVVSPNVVTAVSPAGTGAVTVSLTTPGGTAVAPTQFTYYPPPSGVSISPDIGSSGGGTTVTITGSNLSGTESVQFGQAPATGVTQVGPNTVTAVSPAGTGSVDVSITTPGGSATGTPQFTYVAGPSVTSITPASGPASGAGEVTIAGTGLAGTTGVDFGSAAAQFTNVTDTSLTAFAPPGTGEVSVVVTTPGGTAIAPTSYTYLGAPTITGITPASGPAGGGTSVTITGTGLSGATVVGFGATQTSAISGNTDTSVTVTAPAGTGTVPVTIFTPAGAATSPIDFAYITPPAITAISPATGPVTGGTTVKISGTGLSAATGVHFGSVSASFGFVTADSLVATVPAGTGTVAVTVTTPGGTATSPTQFAYFALPVVKKISPSSGPQAGGTKVTITGSGLSGATKVRFGAAGATIVTDTSTTVTVTAPAGKGVVDVSVTTPDGIAVSPVHFTYTAAVPKPAAGFWMVGSDGSVFGFGAARSFGSMGGRHLNKPIVAMAATPDHAGYWLFASDGGVFTFGDARFYGSVPQVLGPKRHLAAPIVAVEATSDGRGYRMFAGDGGVFDFGDARYVGSLPGIHTHPAKPIVAAAAVATGQGYWLIGADGGVYGFGGARFEGSLGNRRLSTAIVGMTGTSTGRGYWIFGADGEVWRFGDARWFGAPSHVGSPVTGGVTTSTGRGYWLIARNGSVFRFGDAPDLGSLPARHITVQDIIGGVGF